MDAAQPYRGSFDPVPADADALARAIEAAQARIADEAVRTPLLRPPVLAEQMKATVGLKCETFQRTGAFKFRGAFNAISMLSPDERARGVLSYSSGNHAQALALAGRMLGVEVTVVMPSDAPVVKREATEGYGAQVIVYDRARQTREAIAHEIQQTRELVLIPPYDHPSVIAGQGTVGLEIAAQMPDVELVLVPTGGGGLLSGVAAALRAKAPGCRIVGIEPALADDATRSFHTGTLHQVDNPPTIADGARTPYLGRYTFPLIRELVDDMQTVSEKAIVEAVRYAFRSLKLVVEPAGALGLAALLDGVVAPASRTVVVLSGGNVDLARFALWTDACR